jgi:hypothetical protein
MTRVPIRPLFLALAVSIVAASALGLWWLLRREGRLTLLVLAVLTSLSLALRLAYTTDYPNGLNEDEPKVLYAAGLAVEKGTLLAESNISVPILPHALFQGQLVPLLGPGRWAIRAYSLLGGVLCTPAAFAAARALQLAVAPSLAVGGLVAVLPWALFYSRVMTGAELTFQQLLLVAALARLVFASAPSRAPSAGSTGTAAGWREWALGSFALAWMLYGYWCTRAMLGMPFVAAVLARGRQRLWCLAIPVVPLLLYAPYLAANRHSMFIAQGVSPSYYAGFGDWQRLAARTLETLTAFVRPVAEDGWLTIRSAALHPVFLLVVAFCGALTGVRRAAFLFAGFLGGLAPAILAWGPPSTHRMLMAFPFVALAAGCALDDLLVWRRVRQLASAALVLAVGWYGVRLYFSDQFWPAESRWKFDGPRTALLESLPFPPGPPVILMRQMTYFRDARRLVTSDDQDLVVENWFPTDRGAVYAFTSEAVALRPFYEQLFGPRRVETFGWTFKVTLEPGDWSWLRQHGWSYEARCGDRTWRGQVPVLFQPDLTFTSLACTQPAQHTWRARWEGPATPVRLHAGGAAVVEAGGGHFESPASADSIIDFTAEPGMDIRVGVSTPAFQPWVYAALLERTPAGERVPAWERATPVFDAAAKTGLAGN